MLEALQQQLDAVGITMDEFSELTVRLLEYGILSRDESQVEQQLYDRFARCESLVSDYFSVMHIRFLHDRQFEYVRLYPPGADIPGQPSVEQSAGAQLRNRLTQQEVALVLVLRTLYDQGLREARLDEQGVVATTVENVGITLRNLLGRQLPENITERRQLWRRLRQWRLIRMAEDAVMETADAVIQIRPTIVSLVSDSVLQQLDQPDALTADTTATEPEATAIETADVEALDTESTDTEILDQEIMEEDR
ncbi:DUF4194 domain-containing protein [Salinispirillum sp. LH 10-3-1]|uniref:DUF4194 domain-containing protein n=1 Tax=Salinispirillum sp. LH 10-3-1 TaxID=2952525 RepID=A0AB38YIL5_9GAMM